MKAPVSWLAEHVDLPEGITPRQLADALVRVGMEVEGVESGGRRAVRADRRRPGAVTASPSRRRTARRSAGARSTSACTTTPTGAARHRLRRAQLRRGRPRRRLAARRGAARRLRDRGAQDLRPRLRRHDLLGPRARHRRGPRRHPGAAARTRRSPATTRSTLLGLRDAVLDVAVTTDRGYCLSIRGLAREAAAALGTAFHDVAADAPAASTARAYEVHVDDPSGVRPVLGPRGHRARSRRADPGLDGAAAAAVRHALDLAGRRRHQLRDARDRPAAARLRPRQAAPARSRVRRATAGGEADHPRRRRAHPRPRGPRRHRRLRADRARRGHGRRVHRDRRRHHRRRARGRALGPGGRRPHRAPAPAAQRGRAALRARRRPRDRRRRRSPAASTCSPRTAARTAGRRLHRRRHAGAARRRSRWTRSGPSAWPACRSRARTSSRTCRRSAAPSRATDALQVHPPSWRPDLLAPADLVEEVVRLAGYDRLPSVLPAAPAGRGLTGRQTLRRAVTRAVAAAGFTEVLAYPFVSPTVHDTFGLAADDPRRHALRLVNPLVRRRARAAHLAAAGAARRGRAQPRPRHPRPRDLRERAGVRAARRPVRRRCCREWPPARPTPTSPRSTPRCPTSPSTSPPCCAATVEGRGWWGDGRAVDWADAVEFARVAARAARVELSAHAAEHAPWHPGRCAELRLDGEVVGHAGELHPGVVAALGLPERTCAVELVLDALPVPAPAVAPDISAFPPVLLDVALVIGDAVPAGRRAGARCARRPDHCWSRSGCSPSTPTPSGSARVCGRSPSPCGSVPPTARSPSTRPRPRGTRRSRPRSSTTAPACADPGAGGSPSCQRRPARGSATARFNTRVVWPALKLSSLIRLTPTTPCRGRDVSAMPSKLSNNGLACVSLAGAPSVGQVTRSARWRLAHARPGRGPRRGRRRR